MATKPLITPQVLTDWIRPSPDLLNSLSLPLADICDAELDKLVGYAAAHCLPWSEMPMPVSEYVCAFLATGDGGCKPAALRLPDEARESIGWLESTHFGGGALARRLHADCGIRMKGVQLETVIFRDFMIAFPFADPVSRPRKLDVRIYVTPAATTEEASRLSQEIRMVFDVLGKIHDLLEQYRFRLPSPEQLLRGPADAGAGRSRQGIVGWSK